MEFAGQDLRNIVLAVLARHPEGLLKLQAYEMFKREFIERGNEWSDLLDQPCGAVRANSTSRSGCRMSRA